jgi:hypothetical protein
MADSYPEDAPPPKHRKTVVYTVTTIESVAWLLASCTDEKSALTILERARIMLGNAWTEEHKHILRSTPYTITGSSSDYLEGIKNYWDEVASRMTARRVATFKAYYGEAMNPPGDIGNVDIRFQPPKTEQYFDIKVRLNDQISREDYTLIREKAGF